MKRQTACACCSWSALSAPHRSRASQAGGDRPHSPRSWNSVVGGAPLPASLSAARAALPCVPPSSEDSARKRFPRRERPTGAGCWAASTAAARRRRVGRMVVPETTARFGACRSGAKLRGDGLTDAGVQRLSPGVSAPARAASAASARTTLGPHRPRWRMGGPASAGSGLESERCHRDLNRPLSAAAHECAYRAAGLSGNLADAGGWSPIIRGAALDAAGRWLAGEARSRAIRAALCRERHQLFCPARSDGSAPQRDRGVARPPSPTASGDSRTERGDKIAPRLRLVCICPPTRYSRAPTVFSDLVGRRCSRRVWPKRMEVAHSFLFPDGRRHCYLIHIKAPSA